MTGPNLFGLRIERAAHRWDAEDLSLPELEAVALTCGTALFHESRGEEKLPPDLIEVLVPPELSADMGSALRRMIVAAVKVGFMRTATTLSPRQ